MDDRAELLAIQSIAALQAARIVAARGLLAAAEEDLAEAARKTAVQTERRSAAIDLWSYALARRRPDPHFLVLAGDWLVEQERSLHSAALDEEIERRSRDAAAQSCAQSMAQRDVTDELRLRLARRIARARDERDAQTAGERYLSRRSA